jgi:GNAT superfamily N-acetyltransferase
VFSPDPDTNVREAFDSDAARIAALALQLGYEVPQAHVVRTLARRGPDFETFVAVVPRVGVVGWVTVSIAETMTATRHAELEGLVVDGEYRGGGIGGLLLERAERFAREHGCATLRLRSNVLRERAHAFYERAGYASPKAQRVYEKRV